MPHKRAKASIRKANSDQKGVDLPPNIIHFENQNNRRNTKPKPQTNTKNSHGQSKEPEQIPKNMYRILNAEKIRTEFRLKKRKREDEDLKNRIGQKIGMSDDHRPTSDQLKILPGEKLSAFNSRVESTLRSKVTAVMKAAKNKTGSQRSDQNKQPTVTRSLDENKQPKQTLTEQQSSKQEEEQSKREVIKPKDFENKPKKFPINDVVLEPPHLKLSKSMKKIQSVSNRLPISLSQKRLISDERQKVIERYREIKLQQQQQ